MLIIRILMLITRILYVDHKNTHVDHKNTLCWSQEYSCWSLEYQSIPWIPKYSMPSLGPRNNNKSTMTECNHGRGPVVIDLISSSTSDDDDYSVYDYRIDSDYDSFELGIDEHGRLTSMPWWDDENDNNQPLSTAFPRRILHIVVLFVSLMIHVVPWEGYSPIKTATRSIWKVRIEPCFPCCRHGRQVSSARRLEHSSVNRVTNYLEAK
jgi:hypothetical protein